MRVAVLTPPPTAAGREDLDDTFVQAAEITTALEHLGHQAVAAIWLSDRAASRAALAALAPDIVFNLVEDVDEGPDHVHIVTALLDGMRLPYTGAQTQALEALGDKPRMKAALAGAGLPVAPGLDDGAPHARYIVKSRIEHASIGLSDANVVTGRAAAEAMVAELAKTHGGGWFAELYVDGREFNVAVLETGDGPQVLPVAEILFLDHAGNRPKILGYEEKWDAASAGFASTPRVLADDPADASLHRELGRLALSAWDAFALAGYARVDFRVDPSGQPVILEVNANPCLAADAGFCAAAAKAGMSQTDVVHHLLAAAQS